MARTDEEKDSKTDQVEQPRLSRRNFLKIASATTVSVVTISSIGCQPGTETSEAGAQAAMHGHGTPLPVGQQYPDVPYAPLITPDPHVLNFFTVQEARSVEALTARILPGTPDDPGAREAGVVTYIDNLLSRDLGYAEHIYRQPPYAEAYEGDEPPDMDNEYASKVIWVKKDELPRYGLQSVQTPREMYRAGLVALDNYTNQQHGASFVDLSEAQQDEVLTALANDEASGFTSPSGKDFFELLRRHTIEGMFGDPAYGGNRNKVGWRLIGYPGAQRAYTPRDIRTEGLTREPQSLAELPPFHPGEALLNSIVPVSREEDPK